MANLIQLNTTKLMQASVMAKIAAYGIDVKLDEWTPQGESSIALEAYAQQFVELEKALQMLQQLVDKDAEDIGKVALAMFLSDLSLAASL